MQDVRAANVKALTDGALLALHRDDFNALLGSLTHIRHMWRFEALRKVCTKHLFPWTSVQSTGTVHTSWRRACMHCMSHCMDIQSYRIRSSCVAAKVTCSICLQMAVGIWRQGLYWACAKVQADSVCASFSTSDGESLPCSYCRFRSLHPCRPPEVAALHSAAAAACQGGHRRGARGRRREHLLRGGGWHLHSAQHSRPGTPMLPCASKWLLHINEPGVCVHTRQGCPGSDTQVLCLRLLMSQSMQLDKGP